MAERTKLWIAAAMKRLMVKKPLEKIRVTEICREAEIERPTQTKYSIRLYCYGTVGMTREWVLQDNITPADVIVRMMFASMPESLRQIYGL